MASNSGVGNRAQVRNLCLATPYKPGVDYPPPIVQANVLGQHLGHGVPLAAGKVRKETREHSARRILKLPRARAQLVETCERLVEICLVEKFAVLAPAVFDRQDVDNPPVGREAVLRGSARRMSERGGVVAQPVHGLDVHVQIRRQIPRGMHVFVELTRLDRCL